MNIKVEDDVHDQKPIQRATYIENPEKRTSRLVAKKREAKSIEIKEKKKPAMKATEEQRTNKHVFDGSAGVPLARKIQLTQPKERRKFERKSTRTAEDLSKMRSKKPVLPKLEAETGLMFGKGYRELHKSRYKPTSTLELL